MERKVHVQVRFNFSSALSRLSMLGNMVLVNPKKSIPIVKALPAEPND